MASQRVGHNWATELNWTCLVSLCRQVFVISFFCVCVCDILFDVHWAPWICELIVLIKFGDVSAIEPYNTFAFSTSSLLILELQPHVSGMPWYYLRGHWSFVHVLKSLFSALFWIDSVAVSSNSLVFFFCSVKSILNLLQWIFHFK